MRILAAAFFFAAATSDAGASSIITIDDNGAMIRAPSVEVLGASDAPIVASSVLHLGAPGPVPDEIVVAPPPGSETSEPVSIPLLPTVIRAGIEGDAFTRSLGPEELKPAAREQAAEEPPAPIKRGSGVPVAAVPPVVPSAPKQAVAPRQAVVP